MIGGYGGGVLRDLSCVSFLIAFVVAVIYIGFVLWKYHSKQLKQKEHHRNADSIHKNEKHEEKPEDEDDSNLNVVNSNVVVIIVLLSIFAIPAFAFAAGSVWGILFMLIGWPLLIFLALFVFIISVNKDPDTYARRGKNKLPDHKLTCMNGHTVSVFLPPGGVINMGHSNLDVNDWSSVWPEKCPFCGAPWHRHGKW